MLLSNVHLKFTLMRELITIAPALTIGLCGLSKKEKRGWDIEKQSHTTDERQMRGAGKRE